MSKRFSLLLLSLLAGTASAGDMDELPDNDAAFQQKVDAFVKPGDAVQDVTALLTGFRFRCSALEAGNGMWCDRLDRSALSSVARRYQIVVTTDKGNVVSAKATTGLVGP
jgi:hypothetical protein